MAWRVLLTALNRIENSDGQAHIIDPKAISKDDLYGFMDPNTRKNERKSPMARVIDGFVFV